MAAAFGQQPAATCPAGRPVDDIIAEVKAQQSKKANRNKNPIPSVKCIWGWCADSGRTPPTLPGPSTTGEPSARTEQSSAGASSNGESTSKSDADRCRQAIERSLQAAHNVEVGDFQFEEKHYPAALSRYAEAAGEKPGDTAIEVRLGRVLEKLNDPPKALEHYEAAAKLGTPEKWAKEAQAAMQRLKGSAKQ